MNAPLIVLVSCLSLFSTFIHAADEATLAAEKAWRQADQELNAAYKALLSVLAKDDSDTLKRAQISWLAYLASESTLKAHLTSDEGSAYRMDYLANSTELTIVRTKQLQTLLKLAKGDH